MIAADVLRVILYEGEGSRALEDERRYELMRGLLEKGYAVTSTRSGGQVSGVDDGRGTWVVLGQFDQQGFGGAQGAAGDLKAWKRRRCSQRLKRRTGLAVRPSRESGSPGSR